MKGFPSPTRPFQDRGSSLSERATNQQCSAAIGDRRERVEATGNVGTREGRGWGKGGEGANPALGRLTINRSKPAMLSAAHLSVPWALTVAVLGVLSTSALSPKYPPIGERAMARGSSVSGQRLRNGAVVCQRQGLPRSAPLILAWSLLVAKWLARSSFFNPRVQLRAETLTDYP